MLLGEDLKNGEARLKVQSVVSLQPRFIFICGVTDSP